MVITAAGISSVNSVRSLRQRYQFSPLTHKLYGLWNPYFQSYLQSDMVVISGRSFEELWTKDPAEAQQFRTLKGAERARDHINDTYKRYDVLVKEL